MAQTAATYAVTALDGVAYGLLLFTVGAGLALIFGTMGVLNLAHGTLYLAGAYLTWAFSDGSVLALITACAAGIVVGGCGGIGLTVLLRPLRTGDHLEQSLVTLGIAFMAAWAYVQVFGAGPLPADPPTVLDGSITVLGHGYPTYRLLFIAVAATLAIGLHLVVRHSRAGMLLRATVDDPDMADATGIHTGRVRMVALAVGGALATFAGVLGAPLLGPAAGVDTQVLTLSLIVVVLGGAGSIPRTLAAALLVGQAQTVGVTVAPTVAAFTLFTLVLVILVVRGRPGWTGRPA